MKKSIIAEILAGVSSSLEGSQMDKLQFVVQRHTLPVSRRDASSPLPITLFLWRSSNLKLKTSISRLINFSRSRDLEVSTLTSSNCGAERIALLTKSSLARSEDLLLLLG